MLVEIALGMLHLGLVNERKVNFFEIQAGVCAVLSSIVMAIMEAPTISGIIACWLPLSYTGFLSMGAAYALQIIGQRDMDSAPAALIMSLEQRMQRVQLLVDLYQIGNANVILGY